MSHVKGTAINSRIRYVRELHGETGYQRFIEQLAPASRTLVTGKILPHEWVPFDVFVDVNVVADRLFGNGDLRLCIEMGRLGAKYSLSTLYRLFYRVGTPMFIFRKASQLWSVHYDSGRIRPVDEGNGHIRIFIEQFDHPHRAHCWSVLGWAAGSIELSGAKVLRVDETACRTEGAPACELTIHFEG